MELQRAETCSTCRFWGGEDGDCGTCRRYPPQHFSPAVRGTDPDIDTPGCWHQPTTWHHNWCGEYQPVANPAGGDILDSQILDLVYSKPVARGVAERYLRTLRDKEYTVVRNLIRCTSRDVAGFKGVGPETLQDVRLALREHGLFLLGDHPEPPTVAPAPPAGG